MKLKDVMLGALVGHIVATADFWKLGGWCRYLLIGLMAAVVFLVILDWAERTWETLKQIFGVILLRIRRKRRKTCTKGK